MPPRVKVYFDGGCRPAGMQTAVVVKGQSYLKRNLGPGSSMDAEWLALIHAVHIAQTLGLENAVFLGDSLAVINQANGAVQCRGPSVRHFETLMALIAVASPLHIRHLKRTQNLAGIVLARLDA